MPYNSLIDRTGAAALIPDEASRTIIQNVPTRSTVMSMATRLPNMATSQQSMPVLSALPTAYFVNGDTGLIQTSKVEWADKYIYAEELGVIVPIPNQVLADAGYDIWGQIRPLIEEAIGVAFDAAVLIGTNAPANYPDDILTAAVAASNSFVLGTGTDIYDDVMSESGLLAKIEADGYNVTGHIADLTVKSKLRGLRDADGNPIFTRNPQAATMYDLDGAPIYFPENAAFTSASALMFSGNWKKLVYAMRQDITYAMSTESVITDGAGNILYNLFQQNMSAMRVVVRLGWQVPNPINRVQTTEASRYPFGVLKAS